MNYMMILIPALLYAQTFAGQITLNGTGTVPDGKKWRLVAGREYTIRIVGDWKTCLYEGEYGGVRVAIISGIEKLESGNRRVYSIFARRELMKKVQDIEGMYQVWPSGIVEGAISRETNLLDTRNVGNIFFSAGQQVSLTGCLMSITLEEVDDRETIAQPPRIEVPPPSRDIYKPPQTLPTPEGTVYRVQIVASKNPSKRDEIQRQYGMSEEIYVEQHNDVYRLSVGNCTTREEAQTLLVRLQQMGFRDAFVIAIKDGVRLPLR